MRRQESQVILRMTRVIARPMSGSAMRAPRATAVALATTPRETKPSMRAWFPSAVRAGLERRLPPWRRTWAASSLPAKPMAPAAASARAHGYVRARVRARGGGSGGFLDRFGVAEAEVFDVEDGLVEQVGDVRVVQRVDDLAAAALADYEPEVSEDPQLVRDGRLLHVDGVGELANRAGGFA